MHLSVWCRGIPTYNECVSFVCTRRGRNDNIRNFLFGKNLWICIPKSRWKIKSKNKKNQNDCVNSQILIIQQPKNAEIYSKWFEFYYYLIIYSLMNFKWWMLFGNGLCTFFCISGCVFMKSFFFQFQLNIRAVNLVNAHWTLCVSHQADYH